MNPGNKGYCAKCLNPALRCLTGQQRYNEGCFATDSKAYKPYSYSVEQSWSFHVLASSGQGRQDSALRSLSLFLTVATS